MLMLIIILNVLVQILFISVDKVIFLYQVSRDITLTQGLSKMLKISDLTSCWKERLVSGKVSPTEFIKLHKVDNNLFAYKACEPQL